MIKSPIEMSNDDIANHKFVVVHGRLMFSNTICPMVKVAEVNEVDKVTKAYINFDLGATLRRIKKEEIGVVLPTSINHRFKLVGFAEDEEELIEIMTNNIRHQAKAFIETQTQNIQLVQDWLDEGSDE